jgi:hypothetical protein
MRKAQPYQVYGNVSINKGCNSELVPSLNNVLLIVLDVGWLPYFLDRLDDAVNVCNAI